jgi:hypothetical protein
VTTRRIDLSKEDCIHRAARRLLADGIAKPGDTVEAWRGEILCLTGVAWRLAEWAVVESDRGSPTFSLRRYKAFPVGTVGPRTAETLIPGLCHLIQAAKPLNESTIRQTQSS